MTTRADALDDVRAYLDDADPDAFACIFAEANEFDVALAGDDDEIAAEYLLGALINKLAVLRERHPEDVAKAGLRAAIKLDREKTAEFFVDRTDLD